MVQRMWSAFIENKKSPLKISHKNMFKIHQKWKYTEEENFKEFSYIKMKKEKMK